MKYKEIKEKHDNQYDKLLAAQQAETIATIIPLFAKVKKLEKKVDRLSFGMGAWSVCGDFKGSDCRGFCDELTALCEHLIGLSGGDDIDENGVVYWTGKYYPTKEQHLSHELNHQLVLRGVGCSFRVRN